ncbi:MAG TPA: PIN domain-containing protein [Nevskiaceae bacterium]|nr:PIN domain-containing protein [Nevskiaceae bacterium]
MVILDTNIIIDHLRRPPKKISLLVKIVEKKPKENLAISMISIQELYEGRSTKSKTKEQYLLATIAPLKILPYNYEVAQLAGEIARDLNQPIELADAAIAATAILNGTQLFTLNKRDFRGIKNLELM